MATVPKKIRKDRLDSKSEASSNKGEEKDTRSLCERVNCPTDKLTCVLEACHQCINRENRDTSNHGWMHLSLGEHVCSQCVEFYNKSQGIGYTEYYKWKKVWTSNARSEPQITTFIGDQLLPYWTQCMRCSKWREMGRFFNLGRDLAEQYICTESCNDPEDERVSAARQTHWINTLLYPPYLTQSPAEQYLRGYYPDAVGMSATERPSRESGGDNFTRPFHESPSNCMALSIRPDVMDYDETLEFREFAAAQQMYLCLRNLVVASWSQNNTEWLTLDKCRHSVICRGLVRIRCVIDLDRIIRFLTQKNVINTGILPHPPPSVFSTKGEAVGTVIVIGAGTAGLAAALHLYKQGVRVRVLEAKERLGGRVQVSRLSTGALLTLGPDIINGSINNPIALMARQCKLVVQEFPLSNMVVLGKQNRAINADSMRKAENRYLEILDMVYEWARSYCTPDTPDVNLREKVKEFNAKLNEEEDNQLNEEEEQVLELHLMTLSMGSGCRLEDMSAKYWNIHEEYPQFGGPSFIVKQGLGTVLNKMAANLTIEYGREVVGIEHSPTSEVRITCQDRSVVRCHKVICTVSVSVLQNNEIIFSPELPSDKLSAIRSLRCGKLEKVVMHFKKKFWAPKMHGVRLFTSQSILADPQSPFHLIHDMSSNTGHVLAMYICGDKVYKYEALSRDQREAMIGDVCLQTIRKMFPNAPPPMCTSVSRWTSDTHTGMSRSYLPVGIDDTVYKRLGESVSGCLYFAGEATLGSHPNLMTGAYLSGVRSAIDILDGVSNTGSCDAMPFTTVTQ